MPPTISLEAAMPTVTKMRQILLSHPEVITVVSQHGRPDDGSDAAGFYNAEFFAPLKPFEQWPPGLTKEKLVEELHTEFSNEFPGVDFNFSQYIQDNIEEQLSGVKGANSVKIIGPDLATLEQIATQVHHEMAQVKGVDDLGIFRVLGQPNLNIKVDREKTARYGLNAGDVNTVIQTAMDGNVATTVLEGDRQFNLTVRLAPEYRNNIEAVRNIKVGYQTTAGIAYVPLSELADITLDTGASYIYHERNQRYIPIKFSVRGRDLGGAVEEAQSRIAQNVKLPSGYRIEWAGEFGELQEATGRLEVIVPVTLFLIMVILYSLFNSLRDSLLVLAGNSFCHSRRGDIALCQRPRFQHLGRDRFRIAVRGLGHEQHPAPYLLQPDPADPAPAWIDTEAMFHAAEQRMRPMLMTALSACIGLLPAALSTGIGSQVQRPLAAVIVGGMLIGPIMLLVFVPPLRMLFLSKPEVHGNTE